MGFLPLLPSRGKSGKRIINRILPLLPSCGKSGKRMNYGIFATFAIMWQKWQKDELWDLPLLPSCGKSGKRMNYGICHFCHHVAKVAKG